MYYAHTLFNYEGGLRPRPWVTGIYNTENKKFSLIPLFFKGTKTDLLVVKERIEVLKKIVHTQKVSLNDFKAHIDGFGLSTSEKYKVYSRPEKTQINHTMPLADAKIFILKRIKKAVGEGTPIWQRIEANAHLSYSFLEYRGVSDGVEMRHPRYDTHIFSGRSRTTGYDIHGKGKNDIVEPVSQNHTVFVHLDWIAADLRAASIMSKDTVMVESFINSDPYTVMSDDTGQDRDRCKIALLSSIYALHYEDPVLEYYPQFKQWMKATVGGMRESGYVESILKRKFYLADSNKEDTEAIERSVFNACLQGSVAHAMHRVIYKLGLHFPAHLLAEKYDSVILTCEQSEVSTIIKEAGNIMFRPFKNVLKDDPAFPVSVSIGPKWEQYRPIREIR